MVYTNQDTLPYFTAVIKNIASPNVEVKKLVYAYLVQHAEAAPDTALLSINTIQKGLSDVNPQARAMALRTMSNIRVPVISQIVQLGIKRGVGDMSPHVRKAAALAIPKCYRLDPSTLPGLVEHVSTLLGDRQYFVAGPAVMAFLEICPDRYEIIHPHYRGLVKKLVDMDEWSQLATLKLMTWYCRTCISRSNPRERGQHHVGPDTASPSAAEQTSSSAAQADSNLDPDLELLLRTSRALLQSRNSAVILAVVRCYLYLGTTRHLALVTGPLISLLRASPDVQTISLPLILEVCGRDSRAFAPYVQRFFLRASDGGEQASTKLKILSQIFPHLNVSTQELILDEFAQQTKSLSPSIVRAAVRALSQCANTSADQGLQHRCLEILLSNLSRSESTVVDASVDEIRHLVQNSPSLHAKVIVRLAKNLDALNSARARASVIWLVGEFASPGKSSSIASDVLRILLQNFASETTAVQAQILLLAAKLFLHIHRDPQPELAGEPEKAAVSVVAKMFEHALVLSRYSRSYVLRDRARLLRALALNGPSTDLAALLLLAAKPSATPAMASLDLGHNFGSSSWLLKVGVCGNQQVPKWASATIGAAERAGGSADGPLDGSNAKTSVASSAPRRLLPGSKSSAPLDAANGPARTLDDWLNEGNGSSSESEDEEGDDDDEGEEEDDDDDEETGSEETFSDDDNQSNETDSGGSGSIT